jgi:hypothetical protein
MVLATQWPDSVQHQIHCCQPSDIWHQFDAMERLQPEVILLVAVEIGKPGYVLVRREKETRRSASSWIWTPYKLRHPFACVLTFNLDTHLTKSMNVLHHSGQIEPRKV